MYIFAYDDEKTPITLSFIVPHDNTRLHHLPQKVNCHLLAIIWKINEQCLLSASGSSLFIGFF